MFVLDTSVITRLRNSTVRSRVTELDRHGVHCSTMTELEIGYSARSADEWTRLQDALANFQRLVITPVHVERARSVQRLLAGAGLRGRKVPDLLIAAAAELSSLTVVHYDADFDHIASVTHQPTEWIVPRGTID